MLRKKPKVDKLQELFPKVGDKMSVADVCLHTEIKNYNTLKAFLSYIRNAKHIPDANRVDLRLDQGMCERVK